MFRSQILAQKAFSDTRWSLFYLRNSINSQMRQCSEVLGPCVSCGLSSHCPWTLNLSWVLESRFSFSNSLRLKTFGVCGQDRYSGSLWLFTKGQNQKPCHLLLGKRIHLAHLAWEFPREQICVQFLESKLSYWAKTSYPRSYEQHMGFGESSEFSCSWLECCKNWLYLSELYSSLCCRDELISWGLSVDTWLLC